MSEKTKQKDSNELLNWLLIIVGLLFVVQAIMQFLAWAGVPIAVPGWLTEAAAIQLFGSQGLLSIVLGVFAIVVCHSSRYRHVQGRGIRNGHGIRCSCNHGGSRNSFSFGWII
ncbi:MAG: hypothetical protein ACTSP9_15025 [Promethearchaeota archaeon]